MPISYLKQDGDKFVYNNDNDLCQEFIQKYRFLLRVYVNSFLSNMLLAMALVMNESLSWMGKKGKK